MKPLRVLFTNNTLSKRAGTELFVRDLALELARRGHAPVCYSPILGEVADEIRSHTIPVADNLGGLSEPPDLIHGHHHLEVMTAALHFPQTPILFVCHGWAPWEETPVRHPNIMRYAAVDALCRERLATTEGIEPSNIATILNFADLNRFHRVGDLSPKPQRALIFSNYGKKPPPEILEACEDAGVASVDLAGAGMGEALNKPENVLADYDLVFAKARAAIEAMASGCAVILCDSRRHGGLVTPENFDALRPLNFGARALEALPFTRDALRAEIDRYDRGAATIVTQRVRAECGLASAVDQWLSLYNEILTEWRDGASKINNASRMRATADYLRGLSGRLKERNVAARKAERLKEEIKSLRREAHRRRRNGKPEKKAP